ncbi:MAG: NAD(P)-binding domain-containing protein [Pseudomonadota bacterium]|nr:MAG: NADP oxidoreductase [Pseudomonadota bacterium]
MKIGIIGAGNIGGTLTRRLRELGHEVYVANSRGPHTLRDLERETGAKAVTAEEAARSGEIVVVAIPEGAVPRLPKGLFDGVPEDVAVVDTGNYYPTRDGEIREIEQGMPESVWVSRMLGRPVIKAFNTIPARSLATKGKPHGTPGRVAIPVAGDDPRAKKKVMALIDELGFDPIDAGPLAESWRQQPGSPVYVQDFDAERAREALARATPERKPEFSARGEGAGLSP